MTMANVKIQYTEDMVGQNHATKSDTLNRLVVGVNNFRLIKSGANLTLLPIHGNLIDIAGNIYAVTTLPTLAPAGLSNDTLYYIYLYSVTGTATLEASVTAPTSDAYGRWYKTGDATHALMGMAQTATGPVWVDSAPQRLVISHANRQPIFAQNVLAASRLSQSQTWAGLGSVESVGFMAWADEAVLCGFSGSVHINTATGAGCTADTSLLLDAAVTPSVTYVQQTFYAPDANAVCTLVDGFVTTNGYHYLTPCGKVGSSPANQEGSWETGAVVWALTMG